jgi:hypothetical protein
MPIEPETEQLSLFGQEYFCGKMCPVRQAAETHPETTLELSSRKSAVSPYVEYQSLDLAPEAGNLLGESFWEILSPSPGALWMPSSGVCPIIWTDVANNPVPRNGVGASFLSQILQVQVPQRYYLTARACQGILRRAAERGKELSPILKQALIYQAGLSALPPTREMK